MFDNDTFRKQMDKFVSGSLNLFDDQMREVINCGTYNSLATRMRSGSTFDFVVSVHTELSKCTRDAVDLTPVSPESYLDIVVFLEMWKHFYEILPVLYDDTLKQLDAMVAAVNQLDDISYIAADA